MVRLSGDIGSDNGAGGRPSDYSTEMADEICTRLATGESLRKMCRDDERLPSERTVYRWLLAHEDFCQRYARARELQAEPHLEDILEIADDKETPSDQKRVMIDARKWSMSKLAAKKYGERKLLGSDPENPLPSANIDLSGLSAAALAEIASLDPDA